MMKIKKSFALLTLIFAITLFTGCGDSNNAPATAKTSPLDTLLDNMITEYGGEENLKKLDSYISVWEIHVKAGRAKTGKAVNFVELADKLRVELIYKDGGETRILNGEKGYKAYNRAQPQEVSGPKLSSMRLQLMRLYTPLVLKHYKANLSLAHAKGYNLITFKEHGLTTVYHVNATTNRIDQVVGQLKMGPRTMEFVTEYSDFKKVDGVLMHHKENKFAGGMNTAELYLKELKPVETHKPNVFH